MLILRLIFVLLVIAAMVLLGFYLLYNEQKYLLYFKKVLKFTLYLGALIGIAMVLRGFL